MKAVESISVDVSVVLGTTMLPIHQLLRLGRGAVIELDAVESDDVLVMANERPVGVGEVIVQNGKVAVSITEMTNNPEARKRRQGKTLEDIESEA